MKFYKFLTSENRGTFSRFDYSEYLPVASKPGKWLPKIYKLEFCKSSYHAFRARDILDWCDEQLYEVELRGEIVEYANTVIAQQMRFIRKINSWNEKTAKLFACDCALDALPPFEEKYEDDRPRAAIEKARLFVNGQATIEELIARLYPLYSAKEHDGIQSVAYAAARAVGEYVTTPFFWKAAEGAARAAGSYEYHARLYDTAKSISEPKKNFNWEEVYDYKPLEKYVDRLLDLLEIND